MRGLFRRRGFWLALALLVGGSAAVAILFATGTSQPRVAVTGPVTHHTFAFAGGPAPLVTEQLAKGVVPLRVAASGVTASLGQGVNVAFARQAAAAGPVMTLDLAPTGSKLSLSVPGGRSLTATVNGDTVTYPQIRKDITMAYAAHQDFVEITITLA